MPLGESGLPREMALVTVVFSDRHLEGYAISVLARRFKGVCLGEAHCSGPVCQVWVHSEVSTRANDGGSRVHEDLRLRNIQSLHHCFLVALTHQRRTARILLAISGSGPTV
jgi:hypothetical protein